MGTVDDINRMKGEGKSEGEIAGVLKQRGLSNNEINDSISRSQIKEAVGSSGGKNISQRDFQRNESGGQMTSSGQSYPEAPSPEQEVPTPEQYTQQNFPQQETESQGVGLPQGEEYEGMQPSMLQQPQQQDQYSSNNQSQDYYAYGNYGYPQYQPYQEAVSSDLMNEVAEQVVEEKMALIRDSLEKSVDFRTVAEARIENLNERLRRIEQIIDRLQISVLQKVGDYVNDVGDIKRELEETQKSFKTLLPSVGVHRKHEQKRKHVP
ncbi:hypothetical protein HY450_00610 [Candidatus Pacearchaeota archaeon]|nr:hypothetical protein [Candidatus Pacearchaeota archaeon]